MSDFLLTVGVDVNISYEQMQKDIASLITRLNENQQLIRIGLEIDKSSIAAFKSEIANIHNTLGGFGSVVLNPISTNGLDGASSGIAHMSKNVQTAISRIQTMRSEIDTVNTEKIQQAFSSIDGISTQGAAALASSLSEANVRATEVEAVLADAADEEQRLVSLQIRGENADGQRVTYLMRYNAETGKVESRLARINATLVETSAAEQKRVITVENIANLYQEIGSVMSRNRNASGTEQYAGLAGYREIFGSVLTEVYKGSTTIEEAFAKIGINGVEAFDAARAAMTEFRFEAERTATSGTTNFSTLFNTMTSAQNLLTTAMAAGNGFEKTSQYSTLKDQLNSVVEVMRIADAENISFENAFVRAGTTGSAAIESLRQAMSALKFTMSETKATDPTQTLTPNTVEYTNALQKVNTLLASVRANTEKWTAAKHGSSSGSYEIYMQQAAALESLSANLQAGKLTASQFANQFEQINRAVNSSAAAIRAAGENTHTWGNRIKGLADKFGTWFGITQVIMYAYRGIRKMVTAVVDLDTAMTELRKVTDETEAVYDKFLTNATERAKTLGATLSDAVTASADFARLGYNIEEAEKLTDAAIVYKNVGDGIEDISDASESIISTMQAFGIAAEDAMTIVDKFNEVGNNYAISSQGVGEALIRSAAAMHSANNSLDETIAIATAANTVTQDPEKVGTALKTLSMYLRAAKTEAEEAGESTDGMASSVSELRSEILSLTGKKVDIQVDENTFKSTYEILKELSEVWNDLTDVSQANITELVGGKRNSNVVSALLENFSVAEAALETSSNAAGSALAENEKYLNSIEGKVSQFKATFESFSNALINSEFVKGVVDAGSWLFNILDALQKIHTLIPIIAGGIAAIKGLRVAKGLAEAALRAEEVANAIVSSVTANTISAEAAAVHKASIDSLNASQKEQVATMVAAALAQKGLSEEEAGAILTTLGLVGAETALDAANKKVSVSLKAVMASIPGWGWASLIITGILSIVSAISVFHKSSMDIDELETSFEDLSSTIQKTGSDFATLKKNASDIIPRFVELSKNVNEYGQNVSLSSDDYEEFLSLNNQIAEMFPEINLGMDSNGNAMLALSYSAGTLRESLESLLKVQRQEANVKIAENLPDLLKNADSYGEEIEYSIAEIQRFKNLLGSFGKDGADGKFEFRIDSDGFGLNEYNEFIELLNATGLNYQKTLATAEDGVGQVYTITVPGGVGGAIQGLDRQIKNYEAQIKSKWSSVLSSLAAWLQTSPEYEIASDEMQQALTKIVGNLNLSDEAFDGIRGDAEKLEEYILTYIVNPINNAEPEVQDALTGLFDTKTSLSQGDIDVKSFSASVDSAVDLLEDAGLSEAAISALKSALGVEDLNEKVDSVTDKIKGNSDKIKKYINGLSGTELDIVYEILEANGSMSLKELKKAVADTKKEVESSPITILTKVESLSDGLDQLDEIYADVLDGEDFDFSSILNNDSFKEAFENCGEAYEELIATIAKSPNDLNACQEAFNKLAGEYILNSDALRDVTSATRDATINMLEQKGVANAAVIVDRQLVLNSEELSKKISAVTDATRDETVALLEQKGIVDAASIVDEQLALNKEKLRIETELGADATILEMLAQYDEKTASELTAQALLSLVIAKMQANNTEIETTDDINRLLSLAKAAGVTAESLTNLSNAAALISQAEAIELQYASAISQPGALLGGGAQYLAGLKDQATSLRDEAQKLLDKEITYDLPFEPTDFQYAGGTKTKSAKEKSDKDKDDEETWFDKQLKKHQHLVNMEQESEAEYLSWLKSAYKKAYKEGIIDLDDYRKYKEEVFEKSRELFEDKLNDTEHKISLLESDDGNEKKIITLYEGLIKKVEARIKKARKNGLTDNDDYIQELQNKLQDYADSIKEIQDDITDAAKDALDELVDYRIDMLKDDIEAEKDALDKKLDNLKEFYDKQKELLQDQYDEEKELEERNEKRKAVADIEAELSMLEKDDSAWAQKRKLELQEELSSAQKDLSDFEKESALDKALDALEEVYNSQEAEIEKEIEALDNILNDPQALFNQALSDIKNNSKNQLYYQMLMYNRQYGDGKDETVREMWESAYGALDDYKKLFGKAYNGVTLSNATNTKSTNSNNKSGSGSSNSKSDTSATGNTSNKNSGSKTNSNSSGDAKKNTSSNDTTKPSLKKGSTVQIKESATKFSSKSNNVKMASFVPGGKFTVYGTSGNQVLIGKNGVYTGWVKKTDIVGYASGTKHATSGLHELYEGGAETLFVSSDGSKYRILNDNDKVFSAKATNFLYDFANDGGALLIQKIKDALTGSAFGNITTPITSNEVNMGDIIVQGNADTKTVSEIRRAQRESVEFMLKEFTKLK